MAHGGRSWGQKELIIFSAINKYSVNISKELLYSAQTSPNEVV